MTRRIPHYAQLPTHNDVYLSPTTLVAFPGMTSPTGRTHTTAIRAGDWVTIYDPDPNEARLGVVVDAAPTGGLVKVRLHLALTELEIPFEHLTKIGT